MNCIAVDDELFALKDLTEAITSAAPDVSIRQFLTPMQAVEYSVQNTVDVAFLDIEMDRLNGLELAKRLKDISPKTNIVFVTGYSEYALDAFSIFASGYILKPVSPEAIASVMDNLRNPVPVRDDPRVRVQTFGNFEVFAGDRTVHFSRSKSKELFAYLIHKRGTGCTSKEIASVLFENQPYSISIQKQVQTCLSSMLKDFKDAGIQNIIHRSYNCTSVDISMINCDYYRFIGGDPQAVNEYTGEYMSNYSWADFIIGYLDSKVL
ncbi:LytR/AlgR family response regulator transcription factor [Breznakiella homolactica]|uniref:Response regulator n=1 Tax=Breznakiella homolactica TaxID=2798577 RepID=A0A7T7XPN0_9SPIR|nr:response regulator [Breznakiella homolactica]QQO10152.1 response regulator [Breznakiella homolactica]